MSERWKPLDEKDVDPNPFAQCEAWFEEAKTLMAEPEAVALATATKDGAPSVRMVLLRYHDGASFGWYTNYESRKGEELTHNSVAALLWYCETLGRQIRIEGTVEKMSAEASDAYFATRERGSQLGAHASRQSRPLRDRAELEEQVRAATNEYEGTTVSRPFFWGGYRLLPNRFEFWQHRDDRLHDRVVYQRDGAAWSLERQSP